MPELVTPDGAPVALPDPEQRAEIDREFSRAMAADEPGGIQPPPRRPEKPAAAEAPKRRPGRPRKDPDAKPRVAEKPPAAPAGAAPVDYDEAAASVVTLGWATLAGVPWTAPYACVVDANAPQLAGALANGAKQNAKIAGFLDRAMNGGGGVWALQMASVGANMAVQTLELMRDPALRQAATAQTRTKFRAFLKANGVNVPDEQPAEAQSAPVAA